MLLIVVTMLAIVCLLFYQLAQLSLGTMQKVAQHEKEVRERWTLVSMRRIILPQISAVLTLRERQANLAQTGQQYSAQAIYLNDFAEQLQLNGLPIQLEARDESARFFLPGLLRIKPGREVKHLVERLQQGARLPIRSDEFEKEAVRLASWRDVFENIDDREANAMPLRSSTSRITLWGSGRLNVFRADEEVVSECWRQLFGHFPPRELLEARSSYPPLGWTDLRQRLNLREEQLALADAWLGAQSDCFSLRITLGSESGTQRRYLFVADRNTQHYGFEE